MTKTKYRHGLDMLAEVPDSCKARGKRHPLSAILGLQWSQCCVGIGVIVLSHNGDALIILI